MKKQIEKWKPIESAPNYQVSQFGEIKNSKGHIISQLQHYVKGVSYVFLSVEGKKQIRYVHTLVARAFVPNSAPKELIDVVHIDGNRHNNHFANLKWVTRKDKYNYYNVQPNSSLTKEQVETIRTRLMAGETGSKLALEFNTSEMTISRIGKRLRNSINLEHQNQKTSIAAISKSLKNSNIEDINLMSLVQQVLAKKHNLLSISEINELLVEQYKIEVNETNLLKSKLKNVFARLIKLKLVKRIKTSKNSYNYGLAEWFDANDNLLNEFQKEHEQPKQQKKSKK